MLAAVDVFRTPDERFQALPQEDRGEQIAAEMLRFLSAS
jgi:hypothetical protein